MVFLGFLKTTAGRQIGDYIPLFEVGGKKSLHSWISKSASGDQSKHSTWFFMRPIVVLNIGTGHRIFFLIAGMDVVSLNLKA